MRFSSTNARSFVLQLIRHKLLSLLIPRLAISKFLEVIWELVVFLVLPLLCPTICVGLFSFRRLLLHNDILSCLNNRIVVVMFGFNPPVVKIRHAWFRFTIVEVFEWECALQLTGAKHSLHHSPLHPPVWVWYQLINPQRIKGSVDLVWGSNYDRVHGSGAFCQRAALVPPSSRNT